MALPILLKIPLYMFVGFVEMFLISQRTITISKGKTKIAAGIVFIENFVSMFILYQIVSDLPNNWYIFIAYSIGSSLGTLLTFDKEKTV